MEQNSKNAIIGILAVLLLVAVWGIAYLVWAKWNNEIGGEWKTDERVVALERKLNKQYSTFEKDLNSFKGRLEKIQELAEKDGTGVIIEALDNRVSELEKKDALATWKWVEISIVEDKRCTDCAVDENIAQLKSLPALENAEIKRVEYNDEYAQILDANGIKFLPAIIFNTNKIWDANLKNFLKEMKNDEGYSLDIGAKFDPKAKMTEKGLKVVDQSLIKQIKDDSYVKGNENAKITWLEYSDLQCPFCAKLHNQGTPKEITEKYGDNINVAFQHFPLDSIHPLANTAAQALECIGEQKGTDTFYDTIYESFDKYNRNNFDLEGFYDIAASKGVDKEALKACVESGKYKDKVAKVQKVGLEDFDINSTPGNVLINNETGEYIVISGAYPTKDFSEKIDLLLK